MQSTHTEVAIATELKKTIFFVGVLLPLKYYWLVKNTRSKKIPLPNRTLSTNSFFSLKPHQQRGQWAAPPPLHSPLRVHKTFLLSKQKQKNIQLISQNMGFRVVQGALIYISVELNIIKSGHRNTVHIVGIVFEERTYIGRKFEVRIQYLSGLKHTYIAHNIKIFPTRIWYFAQILTNLHTNLSPLTKSQLYLSCLTKYREILQRLQIIKQVVRDQSSVLFCSFLM